MAAPSYTSDLTDIVVPPINSADWGAFGGGPAAIQAETDYYLIDSDCLSKNAWAADYRGAVYDNTIDEAIPAGDALWVWLTHLTPNSLSTEALGGLRVIMADANTEATFDEWFVGGSDTIVYDDRWICAVVDPTQTADNDGTAAAPYSWFGAGANLPVGGPTKGAPFAINAIRHGREFQITLGDDVGGGLATFVGAAAFDNDSTRRLGLITFSKGVYTTQGLFVMGTAATAVDFRDSNRTLFVARTPKVGATFNGFEVRNAASRVDWTGITIEGLGTTSPGYFEMIDAADVNMASCNFVNMGTFTFQSTGSAQACSWRGCGQITAAGADLTGSTVSGYEGTANTSALVWNVATNPDVLLDGMTFTMGTAATHAIEFGLTSPTSITLRDQTFTGYTGTGSSAALDIKRTTGTVTITLIGTSEPTVQKPAGTTVEFVTNPVTVTAKAVTTTGTAIQNARVFFYATATTGSLPAADAVTIVNAGTLATVAHTGHGMATNDQAWIQNASLAANNGVFDITVNDANEYEYTMGSTPGSSPTGADATFVFLKGLTDINGEISMSKSLLADQSAEGWARRASPGTPPLYKQGPIIGTVSASVDTTFTGVLILDE